MLRVKAGDLDKMSLLFERYHRKLFGFLFHMTYQREVSEDMVQQVFYKMLKYSHTFTGQGEFVHWMYSIARNVLKDQFKKNKGFQYQDANAMEYELADSTSLEDQLESKQAKAELLRAMGRLSEEQREILTLSRFQELKYTEIAGIMNITPGAAKVRVHRAIQDLKDIYLKMERKTGI